MITRALESAITRDFPGKRAVIIYGARRVGKTTLIEQVLSGRDGVFYLDGDIPGNRKRLEDVSTSKWRNILGDNSILFIDEAQRIEDIGIKLKHITDHIPEVSIIASGSSSFDLANKINEPLTGRKWEFHLYPLSFQELVSYHGLNEEQEQLPQRLVYGSYPEVVQNPNSARRILETLTSDYLYKDILVWSGIRHSDKLDTLLKALALQIGSQVTYSELGQLCELDKKTVERYLGVLQQAFIIFRLPSFSRNLRNELKFSRKIYFHDNGIRNAILGSFTPFELRTDVGKLWENYLVSERIKLISNSESYARSYFWRTTQQQEVDYVEELNDKVNAFEFKWNPLAKTKGLRTIKNAYSLENVPIITPDNYDDFLLGERYPV